MGEGKEILKFDGREEIKPCTECTYLGTKIGQSGENIAEIKHRISQTRKAINALNSVWWHKNITKRRKLCIYQTIIQSILMYGAEVWQIPTREINKIVDISFLSGCTRRSLAESDDTRGCICTVCVDLLMMSRLRSKHVEEFNFM